MTIMGWCWPIWLIIFLNMWSKSKSNQIYCHIQNWIENVRFDRMYTFIEWVDILGTICERSRYPLVFWISSEPGDLCTKYRYKPISHFITHLGISDFNMHRKLKTVVLHLRHMIVDGMRLDSHAVWVMVDDLAQRENIPDSVVFSKWHKIYRLFLLNFFFSKE